jgi:hypothetical protein
LSTAARLRGLKHAASAVEDAAGPPIAMANGAASLLEIWGTVPDPRGARLARTRTTPPKFDLETEISVFLLSSCGNDPLRAQILFAPLQRAPYARPCSEQRSEWQADGEPR